MKYSKFKILSLISLLLGSYLVKAQDVTIYSLKECINYSLENNPTSTIYKNEVKISRYKKLEYLSIFLPQISANSTFDYNIILPTSVFYSNGSEFTGIPNDEPKKKSTLKFGTPYTTSANIQLDQKIFDASNMILLKKTTILNDKIASVNVLKNNETIIYNTSMAYYQVLSLIEQERLLKENEKKYDTLLKVIELQYIRGIVKEIDYDQVRVKRNNVKLQLKIAFANKELALNKLKTAMGMNLKEDLKIEDYVRESEIEMPIITEFDYTKLPDYQLLKFNVQSKELALTETKNSFYPTLSAYARYGAQGFGYYQIKEAFTDMYDLSSAGLKLNIPLFKGGQGASRVRQQKLEVANAKENLKLSIMNYELNFENSNLKIISSFSNYVSTKENLELATKVLYSVSLQYEKGIASLSDFLNSDYSYKESQTNYINALIDFFSSRIEYEKSLGSLSQFIKKLK